MSSSECDVLLLGLGAAGSVIAGRLARADPSLRITAVEQGPDVKDNPTVNTPGLYLANLVPESKTASFHVGNKSKHLNGRQAIVPSGQCVGGGSSINFMMYTRASADDYNEWKTEGWSAEDLLPLLKKTETFQAQGKEELHGKEGPLKVSYGQTSEPGMQFIEAAKARGIPFKEDIQDLETGHAVTQWAKWIDNDTGKRSDAAHHFLYDTARENLRIISEHKVKRVIFDGDRAVGAEIVPNKALQPNASQDIKTIHAAKMVVVCGGAMGSPTILERSGIGGTATLKQAGVEQRVDLPGVGESYQDHQLTLLPYRTTPDADTGDDILRGVPDFVAKEQEKYKKGRGVLASNWIDGGAKLRPDEAELKKWGPGFQRTWDKWFAKQVNRPVMFVGVVSSFLGDHSTVPAGRYFTVGSYLMIPESLGSIHITSGDPYDAPSFDPGYLSDENDMPPQVWGYKLGRELARRMPCYRGEFAPGHPQYAHDSEARCRDLDRETAKATLGPQAISAGVAPGGFVKDSSTLADSAPNGASTNGHASIKDERPDEQTGVAHGTQHDRKPLEGIEDLVYSADDDRAIEQYMRDNVSTTWHSMGTCAMKPREDGGVVDPRLNVYGVTHLKVADLSICPGNVASNTNSTALLVGEKAAMLIAEDLGIKMGPQ